LQANVESTEKFEPKDVKENLKVSDWELVHPMMFCFLSHPLQARLPILNISDYSLGLGLRSYTFPRVFQNLQELSHKER